MEKNIQFSVIIPCYNSREFIDKGLSSLEQQTYQNFEVVLVDDCSKDDTYGYLLERKATTSLEMQVFQNEKNSGPGVARNRGMQNARGQFFCFMDADDWYEVSFLEEMNIALQDHQADMAFCDFNNVFADGKKSLRTQSHHFNTSSTKKDYLANAMGSMCLMAAHRSLFEDLKVPAIFNGEDNAIVPALIARCHKVVSVAKPLYNYLYRPNSLSNTKLKDISTSFQNAFAFIYDQLKSKEEYQQEMEYLGVKIVLYAAVLNGVQAFNGYKHIRNIITDFNQKFPNWAQNPYVQNFPSHKRAFLNLVNKKQVLLLYAFGILHKLLLRLGLA